MTFERGRARVGLVLCCVAVAFGVVTTAAIDRGDGAVHASIRRDTQLRARLRAQFAHLEQATDRGSARTPRLPADQRPLWIAAWNRMRACAQAQRFDGVTPVAPSFGDGETPMPSIDLNRPNARVALSACPLDVGSFDAVRVRRAIAEAGR